MNAAEIPDIAAAIGNGIAIDQFPIPTGFGNTDAITMTGDGSEVAHADNGCAIGIGLPEIYDDGVVGVVEVDPLKSAPIEVRFV